MDVKYTKIVLVVGYDYTCFLRVFPDEGVWWFGHNVDMEIEFEGNSVSI